MKMAPAIPSLGSDNHSGVHPKILEALLQANMGHSPSYGTDPWTDKLRGLCKSLFGPSTEAFIVFNGTAANVLCLHGLVESHQAVIVSDVAHVQMDECGAPEKYIGCKLLPLPSNHGKITADQIRDALIRRGDQHYSQVAAVSLTQPTEYGTLYSLKELQDIVQVAKAEGLKVHIDGARFIYAPPGLQCEFLDLTEELGVDAVSFGGTKNGLLFGELCLIFDREVAQSFKYRRKQAMQLPSKHRFVASQFLALLSGSLWRDIATEGHKKALYLREKLSALGPAVTITQPTEANAVFARFPKAWIGPLRDHMFFYVWDEKTFEVRLMVSFDTTYQQIDSFIEKARVLNAAQLP
jgi:threonine aldolase